MWSVFKLAARAAVWRTTPEPPMVGLPTLIGWTVVLAVVRTALQFAAAGWPSHFNPYGLNALVAWLALDLAVAALFVRPAGRATALSALFILSLIADLAAAAIEYGAPFVLSAGKLSAIRYLLDAKWASWAASSAPLAVEVIWWVGAMTSVLLSLEPQPRLRMIARVCALWLALFAVNVAVPHLPIFTGSNFDIVEANWWEYLNAHYGPRGELTRLAEAQPKLLQAEVSALAPRRPSTTDVYAIGIAGMDQEVFGKELNGALAAIATVLPIKEHTIRLINSHETVHTVPLATPKNFATAVHDVAAVMDKNEDVLVLFMTSHGAQTGFALQFPGNRQAELTPQQVAATLDAEGIKNRVVIVSACFSGTFVPPLANDDTIVMTASDAKSTSFGCAPEREWTYFGDALFRQSLQPGTDFRQAFEHARVLISGWEMMDRIAPSNPQAHFGPALVQKLAPFFAAPTGAAQ